MTALLAALAAPAPGGWGVAHVVITIIVIAAVVGILWVALDQFGVTVPPFVVRIFWIVVAAVVAILAIRFLLTL